MRLSSIALVGFAAAIGQGALAQTPAPLRVIRSLPGSDANQLSEISVTFDRPVAGSLDRSIDADSIFRIEPATPGRLEWRDPVTIRLRPSGQLSAGTTYTVTIANTFRSMDGGALRAPYRFSFRVRGPAAVYAQPRSERGEWSSLALNQRFDVVYTMPVDLAKLASTAYVEFSSACAGGARVIRLHAVDQRRVTDDDVRGLERHYPPDPRQALDSLRRIVQLAPDSTMPRNCIGELVAPKELNDLSRGYERWRFATHGDFRIGTLTCSDDVYCPRGPLRLTFTTPVSGATLLRNIKLIPDAKVIIRDTISSRQEWFIEATLEPRTTYALVVDTAIRDVFGERLRGNPAAGARTTGYRPSVDNPFGVLVVERTGMRALSVQHMNVDTLLAVIAPIPDSLEPRVFNRYGWANDTAWSALIKNVP
ncbi:MAG TPA: Ig-like domain-containing protein, partial [Gemmatimonadaceae bacterium]